MDVSKLAQTYESKKIIDTIPTIIHFINNIFYLNLKKYLSLKNRIFVNLFFN